MSARRLLAAGLLAALILVTALVLNREKPVVTVGVLHSFQGELASSEGPVALATEFAIQELNRAGGVLGHRIVAVRGDGASDDGRFESEAMRLLDEEDAVALFGCWTSSSRRTVEPVLRERDALLYYPVFYEGLEQSPHIVYLGASAAQRVGPAVKWARMSFGGRMALVGSDYVYPAAANKLIGMLLETWRGEVVSEAYVPLQSRSTSAEDVAAKLEDAVAALVQLDSPPDVIINTINGDANDVFFRALRAEPTLAAVPVLSFAVDEAMLSGMHESARQEHYGAWSYFASLAIPANERFLRAWHQAHGNQPVSEPMVNGYTAVHLWATAVEAAGSFEREKVLEQTKGLSIDSPAGTEYIDAEHAHAWRNLRIGKVNKDRQFDIVWADPAPRPPDVWPGDQRERLEAWLAELREQRYGGGWGAL